MVNVVAVACSYTLSVLQSCLVVALPRIHLLAARSATERELNPNPGP